jgi:hypothetical protein
MGNEISRLRHRASRDPQFRARSIMLLLMSRHRLIDTLTRGSAPPGVTKQQQWLDLALTLVSYWSLSTDDAHRASAQNFQMPLHVHRALLLLWLQHKYLPVPELGSLMACTQYINQRINYRWPRFADAGGLQYITNILLSLMYHQHVQWLPTSYQRLASMIYGSPVPLDINGTTGGPTSGRPTITKHITTRLGNKGSSSTIELTVAQLSSTISSQMILPQLLIHLRTSLLGSLKLFILVHTQHPAPARHLLIISAYSLPFPTMVLNNAMCLLN